MPEALAIRFYRREEAMPQDAKIKPYWGPVGGWGSAHGVGEIILREHIPLEGPLTLLHQNKRRDLPASVAPTPSLGISKIEGVISTAE